VKKKKNGKLIAGIVLAAIGVLALLGGAMNGFSGGNAGAIVFCVLLIVVGGLFIFLSVKNKPEEIKYVQPQTINTSVDEIKYVQPQTINTSVEEIKDVRPQTINTSVEKIKDVRPQTINVSVTVSEKPVNKVNKNTYLVHCSDDFNVDNIENVVCSNAPSSKPKSDEQCYNRNFKIAGVTFGDRQDNLSIIMFTQTVNKPVNIYLQEYKYKGEPAIMIYANNLELGNIPSDKVSFLLENKDRLRDVYKLFIDSFYDDKDLDEFEMPKENAVEKYYAKIEINVVKK
jgi:hypothetical protein